MIDDPTFVSFHPFICLFNYSKYLLFAEDCRFISTVLQLEIAGDSFIRLISLECNRGAHSIELLLHYLFQMYSAFD